MSSLYASAVAPLLSVAAYLVTAAIDLSALAAEGADLLVQLILVITAIAALIKKARSSQ